MEFRLDNREEDLFHEIFLEELNVKSESKNCPLVSEIELRPKNLTFHVNSDVFVIKRLEFVFKLVSFAHCQMLEIFLHVKNCEALDRFMSFSFYLDFEGEKPQSCIVTVNNSYKNDYFIQKFNVKYPKTLKIRGRYEKTHSKLFKKLLGIRKIKVSESANILDSQKLEMLLQSSRFCVESEDEVLFLLGEWCNTNYVSEETLKILLSLVRWDFVTLFALLEALKFTVLKSTSHFKTIFKQEMCYKSGTALRPLSSSPRINYKPLNTDLSLTNFLEATTKILLNSKNVFFT